eukprot:1029434-Rhodomonas_salina.3
MVDTDARLQSRISIRPKGWRRPRGAAHSNHSIQQCEFLRSEKAVSPQAVPTALRRNCLLVKPGAVSRHTAWGPAPQIPLSPRHTAWGPAPQIPLSPRWRSLCVMSHDIASPSNSFLWVDHSGHQT